MRTTLLLLFIFLAYTASGQVKFQNISFDKALRTAKKEGKLILLQFESIDCNQCNEVANKGLDDTQLASKVNEIFIPLKITTQHSDRIHVASIYNIRSFGTYFIDGNGTLIHSFPSSSTLSKHYSDQVDIALNKAGEGIKIIELENEYRNGNRSIGFIEFLLNKKRDLLLPTDQLLDEYVENLPADSSQSIRTLRFIAQMAPLIGSKADMALRKDPLLFNKAWYSMDL